MTMTGTVRDNSRYGQWMAWLGAGITAAESLELAERLHRASLLPADRGIRLCSRGQGYAKCWCAECESGTAAAQDGFGAWLDVMDMQQARGHRGCGESLAQMRSRLARA